MDDARLAPIRRAPLYEEVAEWLRELIRSEGLQPGQRLLPERDLAQRLQVSRTSVRQAVTALRVMGIVTVRHGEGVFVLRPPEDVIPPIPYEVLEEHPELAAVNELREALESQAARLAARRRTDEDLRQIRAALALMQAEVEEGVTGRKGDREFHAAIVSASRSRLLGEVLARYADGIERISQASLARPGQPWRSLVTHGEIVDAIARRDEDAAYQLMLNHLLITGSLETAPGAAPSGSADNDAHPAPA